MPRGEPRAARVAWRLTQNGVNCPPDHTVLRNPRTNQCLPATSFIGDSHDVASTIQHESSVASDGGSRPCLFKAERRQIATSRAIGIDLYVNAIRDYHSIWRWCISRLSYGNILGCLRAVLALFSPCFRFLRLLPNRILRYEREVTGHINLVTKLGGMIRHTLRVLIA